MIRDEGQYIGAPEKIVVVNRRRIDGSTILAQLLTDRHEFVVGEDERFIPTVFYDVCDEELALNPSAGYGE